VGEAADKAAEAITDRHRGRISSLLCSYLQQQDPLKKMSVEDLSANLSQSQVCPLATGAAKLGGSYSTN
jgi:hypothetical protein